MKTYTSIAADDRSRIINRSIEPQDQYDRQLRWYSIYKTRSNTSVPNDFELLYESVPYRLNLSKINNIRLMKKNSSSQLHLKIICSLIDKKNNSVISNQLQYFGGAALEEDRKGVYSTIEPMFIFYHSKIDKNSKRIQLLLEFYVLQISRCIDATYPIGYAIINPFIEARQKNQSIKKGMWLQSQDENSGSDLRFNVSYFIQLKPLIRLIPNNFLVTPLQQIPCVSGGFLPSSSQHMQIIMAKASILKITTLDIFIPSIFQQQVMKYVERFKQGVAKQDKSIKSNIKTRKIKYGFHNTWALLGQTTKSIQLTEKQELGKKIHTLVFQVVADEQDICVDIWKNIDGVFLLVLIYEIEIIGKELNQIFQLEVALFIRSFSDRDFSQSVNQTMVKGPGKGINGNLIKLSTDKLPSINMEYQIVQRGTREMINNSRATYNNNLEYNQNIEREDLKQEMRQLQLERQKMQSQMKLMQIKNEQEKREALEKQRIRMIEKQHELENKFKIQFENLTREKLQYEFQAKQLKERYDLLQVQRNKDMETHQNQIKRLIISKQENPSQVEQEKQGQLWTKNRRQAKISDNLFDALEKKIPVPKQKKEEKVKIESYEYNQYNKASKFTIFFMNINWLEKSPPTLFYFVVRFFNFTGYRTDNITYLTNSNPANLKLVKESYFLHNQQQIDAKYVFNVDPSLKSNPKLFHKDFLDYLARNRLIIDIFDSNTHLYMGQLNVLLFELLRRKKQRAVSAKQYPIINEGMHYANIQILMQNQEIQCAKQSTIINEKTHVLQKHNTVLSKHPIVIPAQKLNQLKSTIVKEKISSKQLHENRQQERIRLLKQRRAIESGLGKQMIKSSQPQVLQQIQAYKKLKRPEYIREIYSQCLTEHKIISSYFGKAQVFTFEFINLDDKPSSYKVHIQDPDDSKLNKSQLKLIKQPLECHYFCNKLNVQLPKAFDLISEDNTFYLHPGQKICLLFKFISFRPLEQIQEGKRQRLLNTLIFKQNSSKLSGGFTLKVELHEQIVDKNYLYYQNAEQPIQIILPVLYRSPEIAQKRPNVISTYENGIATWISEFELSVRFKSPEIMNKLTFNIILYENQYLDSIRQNWRLEIHAYQAVSIVSKPGNTIKFRIAIPKLEFNRQVLMFASHPAVEFEQNHSLGFSLSEGTITVVNCFYKSEQNIRRSVIIHCVDKQNKQLLYGWRLQVIPWSIRQLV